MDPNFETSVAKLETGLEVANQKLDEISRHYVTKAELESAKQLLLSSIHANNKWVMGFGVSILVAVSGFGFSLLSALP